MSWSSEAIQKLAGEWIFSASILQCEDSIFGRVHLTDNGTCVYLAGGEDLIGRGLGMWFQEGPFIGFELSIYQYVATSTKHVHGEPHRFRGMAKLPTEPGNWSGEWYFCPFLQPPRLVGKFKAQRHVGGCKPQLPPKSAGDVPEEAKKRLIKMLDEKTELPMVAEPKFQPHRVSSGDLRDIVYVPNWLEPKQAEEFERLVNKTCEWERMNTRDTQEFGASSRCPCGRGLLQEPLPQWQGNIVMALHNLGVYHPVLYPANSVRINAYAPGQGIHPHMDGPVYFPRAAIISLGSPCIFDFYRRGAPDDDRQGLQWDHARDVPALPEMPPGTKPVLSLVLEPGSLLVFSGDAFTCHRHGITATEEDEISPLVHNSKRLGLSNGDRLKRGRRLSLTIRHLLPRCACSAMRPE